MSMKKHNLSRRTFLKALGVGGAAAMLPGAASAASEPASNPALDAPRGDELCTLLDLSKCIGCGECVSACREVNAHKFPKPTKPFPKMIPSSRAKPEDWSDKQDVEDRLTPYNWLSLQTVEGEYRGEEFELNIPRRCLHCVNPPCANLCPFGAAGKEKNGIVRINSDVCLGGAKCRTVCPWNIPQRQSGVGIYKDLMPRMAGNGVMYKCDRCYDRIADGIIPACIEVCPEGVQTIGPRKEIIRKAHELAEEMHGFIYGETENGGTNTIYVSPVPFELINEKLHEQYPTGKGKKGKAKTMKSGQPYFDEVPNMMAKEENLAYAVYAAPIAGIAAGLLKAGKKVADYRKKNLGQDTPSKENDNE